MARNHQDPRPTKQYLAAHHALMTGDTSRLIQPRAKPIQYERKHQEALVRAIWRHMWWAPYFSHWPNERIQRGEAQQMAAAGVRRGMPDNWLFLSRDGHQAAVSELKAPETNGRPSKDQVWWLGTLKAAGFHVCWVQGWEKQFKFFQDYAGPHRLPHDPPPPERDKRERNDAIPRN